MDHRFAFAISMSGMALEQLRLDTATMNLAQMNVAAKPGSAVYRAQRVVSAESAGFAPVAFAGQFDRALAALTGAAATVATAAEAAPRLVLDPGHPDANERGYVAYPAIDHNTEMIQLMTAVRAYEANVIALNSAKTMAQRALDIGGNT
jgi:flagellar basal-body rod protein FlgC